MKERSKRRDRSVSANHHRKERQEVEQQLGLSLSLLISCFDFHKTSIILNQMGPLLLDLHA